MKQAGAIVIAQSPDTADYPSMPMAAAQAGADLVLPIYEIGGVLADIIEGAPLPRPRGKRRAARAGGQTPETRKETGSVVGTTKRPPQRDGRTVMPAGRLPITANSPAARAETARLRAAELRRRCQELAAGLGASDETVALARRRAQESLRRAQLAHQAASRAAAQWGR